MCRKLLSIFASYDNQCHASLPSDKLLQDMLAIINQISVLHVPFVIAQADHRNFLEPYVIKTELLCDVFLHGEFQNFFDFDLIENEGKF